MLLLRLFFFRTLALAVCCWSLPAHAQDDQFSFQKPTLDVENKFTNVGNIRLTITNFGTIGTRLFNWPAQPSCEYGVGIEHIYQGGIWVGALLHTENSADPRNGQFLVTTAASDQAASSSSGVRGYEFNAAKDDSMIEKSSLSESPRFSATAVSHQDFVCDYTDRFTRVPTTLDSIQDHTPLRIRVHQESYAWNYPFADFFVILRYQIINASPDTLDSVYAGFWNNAYVHNTFYVKPGSRGQYLNTAQGFDPAQRMAYSFDFNGSPNGPPANSYVGIRLLGSTPFPLGVDSLGNLRQHTYYNAWQYQATGGDDAYLSPTDDFNSNPYRSRYSRMTQSMPQDKIAPLRTLQVPDATCLLSTGPFKRMNPGDTTEVVFAVVCANKSGPETEPASLDDSLQRVDLYTHAGWAQKAYNGEDANGNNLLDPGEDIATRDSVSPSELGLRYVPDGKITRYLLPTPPKRPKVRVDVQNQQAIVYWDKSSAEESVDPILQVKDFEGYRIYRSNAGVDFQQHENFVLGLPLVGEFDLADDKIGYNTGFGQIMLDRAKVFPCDTIITSAGTIITCDTVRYWYRFPPASAATKLLNGWQYIYGVSAFDKGDSANNVESLESAKALVRAIPGTPPTSPNSSVDGRPTGVGVYPNPYYVNAFWDGNRERLRKIYFYNLPARCVITVYTLAGDVVTVLDHNNETYAGEGINWFNQYGDPGTRAHFAGGEHAWDLITRYDQAIATGLYLFTVEDKASGNIERGKFFIIK